MLRIPKISNISWDKWILGTLPSGFIANIPGDLSRQPSFTILPPHCTVQTSGIQWGSLLGLGEEYAELCVVSIALHFRYSLVSVWNPFHWQEIFKPHWLHQGNGQMPLKLIKLIILSLRLPLLEKLKGGCANGGN